MGHWSVGLRAGTGNRERLAWFAVVVIALAVTIEAIYIALVHTGGPGQPAIGNDYRFFRDVGARWLANGSYYLPEQLAGPYAMISEVSVLYPPTALLLFVPFAVLPAFLWWAVPTSLLGWVLWRLRPAAWAWIAMLGLMGWPHAIGSYLFGNTDLWAEAFIALGLIYGWPVVFLAIKPLYLPFALIGLRRRSFWLAAALLGILGLATLPFWLDYRTAMANLRVDPGYWLTSIPLLSIPLIAWLGRVSRGSLPRNARPGRGPSAWRSPSVR